MVKLMIALLLLATSVHPQTPTPAPVCPPKESVKLRGLHVGMKLSDFDPAFRATRWREGEVGESSSHIPLYELPPELKRGLIRLKVEMLDNVVTEIEASYDTAVTWESGREFAEAVFKGLGVPTDRMKADRLNSEDYLVECEGWHAVAAYNFGVIPAVKLFNPETPKIIAARRKELEEKKKKGFKP